MSNYEKISCRIAIQVCIGHFPDGRERHRTFSMKGIDPDAPLESIAAVIRALAPVLAYPITKVRKVTKRVILIYEEAALPVPHDNQYNAEPVMNAGRIIPFPISPAVERPASRQALSDVPSRNAVILPFPSPSLLMEQASGQTGFFSERAPPLLSGTYPSNGG